MTALTHKENELHNRLIVAEFNLGQAEEELRRLHEVNAELVEALSLIQIECDNLHHSKAHRHTSGERCRAKAWIDSVLAKAQGGAALQRLNKAAEDNGEPL